MKTVKEFVIDVARISTMEIVVVIPQKSTQEWRKPWRSLKALRRCKPCLFVQKIKLLRPEEIREELTGKCQLQILLSAASVEHL